LEAGEVLGKQLTIFFFKKSRRADFCMLEKLLAVYIKCQLLVEV